VQVNGAVCKKGDTQLKESDTVAVDGRALSYQQFVYIMLNKPEGQYKTRSRAHMYVRDRVIFLKPTPCARALFYAPKTHESRK
jgi:16S rRNA U516 pseudouridylate synthase RsuA-like enzyme